MASKKPAQSGDDKNSIAGWPMKASNKKTRWLLIALFFGLLAAAGFTLTRHGAVRFVTMASHSVPPKHAVVQQLHTALLASTGGKQTLTAPVGTPPRHELVDSAYSDAAQPHATGHSDSSPNDSPTSSAAGAGTALVGGTNAGTQQTNTPSSAASTPASQDGAGQFAYNGYNPLDCGLPAGCGVGGNTGYVNRQPSLTGGGVPIARNSQGTNPPDDGSGDPGPSSNPPGPGSNTSVTAAPELDPATLAGAITLLLGSLAVLRSRRVRVSRSRASR